MYLDTVTAPVVVPVAIDWTPVILAIVTAIGAISAALIAGLSAWFAGKANTQATATHTLVNSRMTEFQNTLEALADARVIGARAEGMASGEQAQRDRMTAPTGKALTYAQAEGPLPVKVVPDKPIPVEVVEPPR